MTREEAINTLYGIQADNLNLDDAYTKDKYDALTMAIKALEQEPCEELDFVQPHKKVSVNLELCTDAISRQAVIQHICEDKFCYKEDCKGNIYKRCPDTMWVYDLPSVNPQEPTKEEKALLQKWRDNRGISIEEFEEAMNVLQEPKTDKALNLLAEWAVEWGFGYDNIPQEYEKYKDDMAGMGYAEGLAYIAKMESEVKHETDN